MFLLGTRYCSLFPTPSQFRINLRNFSNLRDKTARPFETSENAAFFEVSIFKLTLIQNAFYFKVVISDYLIYKKPNTIVL